MNIGKKAKLEMREEEREFLIEKRGDESLRFNFEPFVERLDDEEKRRYADLVPREKYPSVCKHWLRGLCKSNEYTCPHYHVFDVRLLPVCQFFLRGECTNGDCNFRHPLGPADTVYCVAYAKGFCSKGPKCNLKHDKCTEEDFDMRDYYVKRAIESIKREREKCPTQPSP